MGRDYAYAVPQIESVGAFERPLILKLAGRYFGADEHILHTRSIDEYVLIYCFEGNGWVILNGVKTLVQKGDIIFLPPNQPHSYGNEIGGEWSIIWFHFTGGYGEYFFNQTNAARVNGVMSASSNGSMQAAFEAVIVLIADIKGQIDVINSEAIFTAALCELLLSTRKTVGKSSLQKAYVDKAIDILEKNDSGFISLAELSNEVGVSKYYLIRLFKEFADTTPKEYLNKLKLKKACKLLKETTLSMSEISIKLGFSNQYHFSKSFKQFSGYSPTKFRRFI